jgi:hypothetical protein
MVDNTAYAVAQQALPTGIPANPSPESQSPGIPPDPYDFDAMKRSFEGQFDPTKRPRHNLGPGTGTGGVPQFAAPFGFGYPTGMSASPQLGSTAIGSYAEMYNAFANAAAAGAQQQAAVGAGSGLGIQSPVHFAQQLASPASRQNQQGVSGPGFMTTPGQGYSPAFGASPFQGFMGGFSSPSLQNAAFSGMQQVCVFLNMFSRTAFAQLFALSLFSRRCSP